MPPGPGATFWVEVDRISSSGNGVVDLDDGGHINLGPVHREAVGERIKIKMVSDQFARPLDSEYRKDVYAKTTESTGVSVGDVITDTIRHKTGDGEAVIQRDGAKIVVPGGELGEEVTVEITNIDRNYPEWAHARSRRADGDEEPTTMLTPHIEMILRERPSVDAGKYLQCPVADCNYTGSPQSVAGHVSGKPDSDHNWGRLGYNGVTDFKNSVDPSFAVTDETTLLHLSDTHLGRETGGYGKNRWPIDCSAGFEDAIDIAVELDVDGVLHTGDLFHSNEPENVQAHSDFIRRQINRLSRRGIEFSYILGNHDRDAAAEFLDTLARDEDLEMTELGADAPHYVGSQLALYGRPHLRDGANQSEAWHFSPPQELCFTIAAVHQSVAPISNTDQPECSTDVFQSVFGSHGDIDAVALGHLHQSVIERHHHIPFVCGGATERLGNKEHDLEPFVGVFETTPEGLVYKRYPIEAS